MIGTLLCKGDLKTLFIEHLGWDRAGGVESIEIDGENVQVSRIAHKRGFQVFEHKADRVLVQTSRYVKILQEKVSRLAREHLLVVTDTKPSVQAWVWAYRDFYTGRWCHRIHPFFMNQIPADLVERVKHLAFMLDEEDELTLLDVTERATAVLDVKADQKIFFRSPGYARQSHTLACRMREGGTREFHDFLVFHRQLAHWFGKRYAGLNDDPEEMAQVAMVGLIRAAKGFDPSQGTAFSTYAFPVMQTECWRYLPTVLPLGRVPDHVYQRMALP